MFKGKTLLITGGTGSFGNAVLNRFLDTDIKEIRIFSRDEKKQDDMRHKYNNDRHQVHIHNWRRSLITGQGHHLRITRQTAAGKGLQHHDTEV